MDYDYSKYAERFMQHTGTVQLMEDLASATESSYMLGGGNPAHITKVQTVFRKAMQSILAEPAQFERILGDYSGAQGYQPFIDSLAGYFQETMGWPIEPENIALSNGSQASFGVLFNCFAGAGRRGEQRKVLVPLVPEYIGYADHHLDGQSMLQTNLPKIEILENGFFKYRIDFEALDLNNDIGAICLSRPTNPSGNMVTDEEMSRLSRIAQQAGIPLIIDGAYGLPFPAVVFGDAKPLWNENIVLCLSLSKLGMPGVRTGIIIASEDVIKIVSRANAINMLAPGNVGPALGAELLQQNMLQTLCENEIRPFYQRKMELAVSCIQECMKKIPVRIHKPEGAFFLWLWFEGLPGGSDTLYRRLRERQVYVLAGHHFYPGLEDADWQHRFECIRVSYATGDDSLIAGIRIIAEEIEKLYAASGML